MGSIYTVRGERERDTFFCVNRRMLGNRTVYNPLNCPSPQMPGPLLCVDNVYNMWSATGGTGSTRWPSTSVLNKPLRQRWLIHTGERLAPLGDQKILGPPGSGEGPEGP